MPNLFVRSTDGSDTDNGTTWALAKATLAGAAAIDNAGDNIYLSQAHAQPAQASAMTLSFAGTPSSPVEIITVNDSSEPPTSIASSRSVISTSGNNNLIIQGSIYVNKVAFQCAISGTGATSLILGNSDGSNQIYEDCEFIISTSGTAGRIAISANTANLESAVYLKNCILSFSNASQGINYAGNGSFIIDGGEISVSSTSISNFFAAATHVANITVKNFKFQNISNSATLVNAPACTGRIDFINCSLPSSWIGNPATGIVNTNLRVGMYNCDVGASNYLTWIMTYSGSIKTDTAIVKTDGSSDGTTNLSWKMTTTSNANEVLAPLVSDSMAVWLDSVGTSKTITVDIIHDSTTALTNAEVWLEIDYLGNSANTLGSSLSDKRATIFATPAAQTTSTATWTTTGLTNPNKQKLEVTFTPQMKGFVYARVYLCNRASDPTTPVTIYVDYEPTVT